MDKIFPFYPEAASTYAGRVDALYFFLAAMTTVLTLSIFGIAVFFAIKYRRRSEDERPKAIEGNLKLELLWSGIPLIVCMGIFFWGTRIYMEMTQTPKDALPIYVVGKQWMWKIQHPDGRGEINELHIPIGQKFRMIMTSEDVIHSFYIPAFRSKADVVPGRYTSIWFEATKVGKYRLFCAEYCGTSHSAMKGWVHVMTPADYEDWLSGNVANESMDQAGERLFAERKCNTCHSGEPGALGPSLNGIFGTEVLLDNGQTVLADDKYMRESMLNPRAKMVQGYGAIMPTYESQLNEEQIMQIISYIKTLKAEAGTEGAHE